MVIECRNNLWQSIKEIVTYRITKNLHFNLYHILVRQFKLKIFKLKINLKYVEKRILYGRRIGRSSKYLNWSIGLYTYNINTLLCIPKPTDRKLNFDICSLAFDSKLRFAKTYRNLNLLFIFSCCGKFPKLDLLEYIFIDITVADHKPLKVRVYWFLGGKI